MAPQRQDRRGRTRRDALMAAGTLAGAMLAGCQERLAARAVRDGTIRTVAVESDVDGAGYHPTREHIESGAYSPLTRSLYLYVNERRLKERPALIGGFLSSLFEDQRALAREVGYYATPERMQRENRETLDALLPGDGIDTADVRGEVVCSGSNTVAPITRAAGEDFERAHPGVLVAVEPEGTGAGFAQFVQGYSDIQSASRTILPEEATLADAHAISYTRFEIGWDGIAIVVHEENDWMNTVTLGELRTIWDFGSRVQRWDDIRPDYPASEMDLWGRDDASGTFDRFTEIVTGDVGRIRTDYSPHTDTGSVMAGVGDDRDALGWGGVGYYTEAVDQPFDHVRTGDHA